MNIILLAILFKFGLKIKVETSLDLFLWPQSRLSTIPMAIGN